MTQNPTLKMVRTTMNNGFMVALVSGQEFAGDESVGQQFSGHEFTRHEFTSE